MGKIVKKNQPCLDQISCKSSDARQVYENGSSFCFSCQKPFDAQENEYLPKPKHEVISNPRDSRELLEVPSFPIRGFKDRLITKDACEFFGVKSAYDSDGNIAKHYYPYPGGGVFKVRVVATKDFYWLADYGKEKAADLFGRDKFAGGGKTLIITEGEIDALSVAQSCLDKYQKVYPVVALPSASATDLLLKHRDWIRSFKEVVLCLDNDKAGKEATETAVKIVGLDKVKIVDLGSLKDANEVLKELGSQSLMSALFSAKPYVPSGIITKEELWTALVEYANKPSISLPYFMSEVNAKTKGIRRGEITTLISGTSCGKSTIVKEIALHLPSVILPEEKIGIVSLEEAPAETARKMAGMALKRNPANEEIPLTELKEGFDDVFGNDRYLLLDHQGSLKDESILDKLEFMALSGCGYILIDHITILVSEGADGLTGNEAIDKVMSDLLRFVKRHNVWIGLVSHLRKTVNTGKAFEEGKMPNLDDIKGSGSIKQISFDILAFSRNLMEPDPIKKNTIDMAVLKCRLTGLTGGAGQAYYSFPTGRFVTVEEAPVEEFTSIV